MSSGVFTLPQPFNEPVRDYAPGSLNGLGSVKTPELMAPAYRARAPIGGLA